MLLMLTYKVIVSAEAVADLDEIANYVASIYRPSSGHNFVNRILGQIQALSYSAGSFRSSPFLIARIIHPKAKTMNIIHHRWTVVFHIEDDYVIIDRIIPSSQMAY